jgi:hypothetical protein
LALGIVPADLRGLAGGVSRAESIETAFAARAGPGRSRRAGWSAGGSRTGWWSRWHGPGSGRDTYDTGDDRDTDRGDSGECYNAGYGRDSGYTRPFRHGSIE